ncbi:hypothetical protein FKM82_021089 [Ascaphus truei]
MALPETPLHRIQVSKGGSFLTLLNQPALAITIGCVFHRRALLVPTHSVSFKSHLEAQTASRCQLPDCCHICHPCHHRQRRGCIS